MDGLIEFKTYQIERFINAFDDPYSGSLTYIRNKSKIKENIFK